MQGTRQSFQHVPYLLFIHLISASSSQQEGARGEEAWTDFLREAAVNEWTPVSCSARKFQPGYTGAARAFRSVGGGGGSGHPESPALLLCSLSVIQEEGNNTPGEKRRERQMTRVKGQKKKKKMPDAHSSTYSPLVREHELFHN